MTEDQQNPNPGTTPEDPPLADPPRVGPGPAEYRPNVPEGNEGSGRYAVYDLTLERYVGEVSDSKPSAKDAKALTRDGKYRIIEV